MGLSWAESDSMGLEWIRLGSDRVGGSWMGPDGMRLKSTGSDDERLGESWERMGPDVARAANAPIALGSTREH